jgi:hypothetical protein
MTLASVLVNVHWHVNVLLCNAGSFIQFRFMTLVAQVNQWTSSWLSWSNSKAEEGHSACRLQVGAQHNPAQFIPHTYGASYFHTSQLINFVCTEIIVCSKKLPHSNESFQGLILTNSWNWAIVQKLTTHWGVFNCNISKQCSAFLCYMLSAAQYNLHMFGMFINCTHTHEEVNNNSQVHSQSTTSLTRSQMHK